jgi:hypothetical protein
VPSPALFAPAGQGALKAWAQAATECIGLHKTTGRRLAVAFGDCNQHAVVSWVAEDAGLTLQVASPAAAEDGRPAVAFMRRQLQEELQHVPGEVRTHACASCLHACLQQGAGFIGGHRVGSSDLST